MLVFAGLAVDFALLLGVGIEPSSSGSSSTSYELLTAYVPNLGAGGSVFGIDLGAGLRFQATVQPDLDIARDITAQAGAKLVLDGSVGITGSVSLSSLSVDTVEGGWSITKLMDTPRVTVGPRLLIAHQNHCHCPDQRRVWDAGRC